MEQEEAINKIKKLLRLSESPNENEAKVALKKARELMLQYHVSECSLDQQEKEVIWKDVKLTKKWMTTFYTIISHNNRCDCYYSEGYEVVNGKYKKTRIVHVVGFPFDVECVMVMAQLVEDTVKSGISNLREKIRKEHTYKTSTQGITDSYVYGFRLGLQKAFDEQNAKQEYHLMCITPKEVESEMNEIPNLRTVHSPVKLGYSSNERYALNCGHEAGYQAGMRKQIGDA